MADIFFSYSREDLGRIKPIVHTLEAKGFSIFWDRTIPAGKSWRQVISRELDAARCVMVAWSETSINSQWVLDEADYGSKQSALVPLLLDAVNLPLGFGGIQAADLTRWDGSVQAEPFQKLYRDIVLHLGEPKPKKPVGTHETETTAEPRHTPEPPPEATDTSTQDPAADGGQIENRHHAKQPTRTLLVSLITLVIGLIAIIYQLVQPKTAPDQTNIQPIENVEVITAIHPTQQSRTPYPELEKIEAGCFQMGSTKGDKDELPVHKVCFDRPFYLGKTEVTFEQFDHFAELEGRDLPKDLDMGRNNRPVIQVSWQDARDYTQWLTRETGIQCRLPSEAEWEYAARAGTTTEYALPAPHGSNTIQNMALANCDGCGSKWDLRQTAPVASFPPNAWHLHDMLGNVWEWTADCWHDSYADAPGDGTAWMEGIGGKCNYRVLRGGSWSGGPMFTRSASRGRDTAVNQRFDLGFRILCSGPLTNR